jgi:segregation and condensation protein A
MGISVKLEAFEGPLDLLLHLIDKHKLNIYDIPIVLVAEQYMAYIDTLDTKDMNVMSEFLVMAATLLNIKSKMLLPKEINEDAEEEDPRQELVDRLLAYKMYKYMSFELKDRQIDGFKVLFKESTIPDEIKEYKEDIDVGSLLSDLTLNKLQGIFQSVLTKQIDKIDPIRSKFGKIEKEEINLSNKMIWIEEYAMLHQTFHFQQILGESQSKIEIIVTFLGVLELIKVGKLIIQQEYVFDDILITYKK